MQAETLRSDFLYIPKSALILSAMLHGGLIFIVVTFHILDRLGITFGGRTISENRIYQDYIQVDVVSLPDQMLGQSVDTSLPIVDNPKPKAIDPVINDIIVDPSEMLSKAEKKRLAKEKASTEQQKQAMKAQDDALKKIKADAQREAALKSLSKGKEGRAALKGNRLAQGTSASGLIGTAKDRYAALVKKTIEEHFSLFPWQKKKKLVALVYIEILGNGRVKEKTLVEASTDAAFNATVMQAIESAQPLPVPDDVSLLSEGITFAFKPDQ